MEKGIKNHQKNKAMGGGRALRAKNRKTQNWTTKMKQSSVKWTAWRSKK